MENIEQYAKIQASSTITDSRADVYNIIDENAVGFWAPPLGIGHATVVLSWPKAYSVNKVLIKWKAAPPKVEV